MDKISKFEKELERREISDSERKLKVKINYARALVNFLPGGSKLDKLIFGLVDAKREQELDDILALLVEQIGELKLSQLSFSTQLGEAIEELRDFRLNWSEIGQELEIIIDGVQGIHYELSEHKKLLHDISNKVDKIDHIEAIVKDLLDVRDKPKGSASLGKGYITTTEPETATKDDLLVNLGVILISNVSSMLDSGELNAASKIIYGIVEAQNFEALDVEQKVDLLAIKGDILVKKGKKADARKVADKLLKYDVQTKRKADFLHFYSAVYQNKKIFDIALNAYRTIECSKEEIEIRAFYYDLVADKFYDVIDSLIQNKAELQIKKKYRKSHLGYFYLGLAFFSKSNYWEAREVFIKSNEIKKTLYAEYLIALCDALMITTRTGAFITLTQDEIDRLKISYAKMSADEIEKYFKDRRIEMVTDYWLNRLAVLLHIDAKKALDEYGKVPVRSKKNPNIQFTYADILHLNGKTEESYKILVALHKKHKKTVLLTRILDHLVEKNETLQILKMADELSESEFDNEGGIGTRILEATYKQYGLKAAQEKAEQLLSFHKTPIFIHLALGNILIKEGDRESAHIHFSKSLAAIKKDNYPPRLGITENYIRHDFIDLAINCIKPFIPYNKNAKQRYIDIVLKYNLSSEKDNVAKIIEQEIEKSNDIYFWLNAKADLEYSEGRKHAALKTLEVLFRKKPSPEIANNIVGLRIEVNESGFFEYATILEKQDKPQFLMMAAICYEYEGNKNLVDDRSYRALSKNGDKFDEILFTQYIQLHLLRNPKSSAKVELDKFSKLIEIIGLHDYESMKLAKNLKAFYVADDLFLRKVHNNINHTNRSSNSIAILYYFYEKNTDLLLNELLNLSKGNYLFLFNSPILVHLVKQTVENHPVVGHGTSYEVLENTIRNSLDTRFMFQQYEPILLDTLNRLYELEIAGNYGYVIQRIIKSLKDYYTTYGLDSAILRGKLKLLASMNLSKQTYLETVFNKI